MFDHSKHALLGLNAEPNICIFMGVGHLMVSFIFGWYMLDIVFSSAR